jgi:hypothetical protein
MFQLWTASKLNKLPFLLQREIYFYAPLVDSLDFYGTDPVTYTRAGTTTAAHRSGSFTIAANVPPFEYSGENQLGLYLNAPASLSFSAQNALNDANTLIWFEDLVPKSTPTNTNPIDSNGIWTGNLDIHLAHLLKARRVLANSEIVQIQTVLLGVAQSLPAPPAPPVGAGGSWITETPAGSRAGTVFTLSQDPDLNTLIIFCFAAGALERVASGPAEAEFTANGTGNRTITLALAPSGDYPFIANYRVAGS